MLFNSYTFLIGFLPVTLFIFLWIARYRRDDLAFAWLVGASLFFYGWWDPRFLALILFSVGFNFLAGLVIRRALERRLESTAGQLLAIGVAVNLGLIAYFKYAGFLATTFENASGIEVNVGDITLPLAISFFTFQQIAYLVDVRRGIAKETSPLRYALFVVFFPQLIAGPIVHHSEVLPQFEKQRGARFRWENLAVGGTIFAIGLFKKVVLADYLATLSDPVFEAAENGEPLDFFAAWTGTFAFTFELYFDFSGYSDMAIGAARLFGIRLPINFHSPYKATGIVDFWRRWHMTLSRFLRDYLYIPLGGNRKGEPRRLVNLLITMVLGGLWHGAGWTFVLWGLAHGIMLIINQLWRRFVPLAPQSAWRPWASRSLTLTCVALAWVLFRAETFDGALNVYRGMLTLPEALGDFLGSAAPILETFGIRFSASIPKTDEWRELAWFVAWIAGVWLLPNTQQLMVRARPALDWPRRGDVLVGQIALLQRRLPVLVWRPTWYWAVVAAGIYYAAFVHLTRPSPFLYFQF